MVKFMPILGDFKRLGNSILYLETGAGLDNLQLEGWLIWIVLFQSFRYLL